MATSVIDALQNGPMGNPSVRCVCTRRLATGSSMSKAAYPMVGVSHDERWPVIMIEGALIDLCHARNPHANEPFKNSDLRSLV